ncbi:MAG: DUF362 domain-containing protein [Myxococcota bacterium]|nr:DUF362 domain-containing protein [Myxococcota bacterium]
MHRVFLRRCTEYDPQAIRTIVRETMEALDLRPKGRILLKPNLVIVQKRAFVNAHTRAEFTDGVLAAVRDRMVPEEVTELAVGERCGITMPTRMVWNQADYGAVLKRHKAKRYLFDECTQVEIPLTHPDRLRDSVFTPEPVARADFFINLPKFKAHPWTTVTFSLKNYIGIQDDRHRLIDHDWALNQKIADLQEIVQPQLVAIDAISAGQGRMLTPIPFDMNLVILGDNQVAVDSVCSRIIGLDPAEIQHIALCAERGLGSLNLEDISIEGDVTLAEAQQQAAGFQVGLKRIETYLDGSKIKGYSGPPPAEEKTDYCWGGCPGALQESIEILRQIDTNYDEKLKPMHVVFGAYEGPLNVQPGEKVIFMGDCACWKGKIGDEEIDVQSLYLDPRKHKDPYHTKMTDIFVKMLVVLRNIFRRRKSQVVRVGGCPVSVAEQTLYVAQLGGVKNPYIQPSLARPFVASWIAWRFNQFTRWVRGAPYQRALGPDERGEAAGNWVEAGPSDQ